MSKADSLTGVLMFFIPCNDELGPYVEGYLVCLEWRSSRELEKARQWFYEAWANALAELEKYVRQGVG